MSGADRARFLQGLITNDVAAIGPGDAVYAALLTPQGRYLHDFIVAEASAPETPAAPEADGYLLDVEAARLPDLISRLQRYRLRAKVGFEDVSARFEVLALSAGGTAARLGLPDRAGASRPFAGGVALVDPRLAALGVRLIVPRAARSEIAAATGLMTDPDSDPANDAYDRLRLAWAVPDGSRDLEIERSLPLEYNLDQFNAISWTKGCYVGQEVTARTRYRGLLRRRLSLLGAEGGLPAPGTPVLSDGQEVGEIRSGRETMVLALLRLDLTGESPLTADGRELYRLSSPEP